MTLVVFALLVFRVIDYSPEPDGDQADGLLELVGVVEGGGPEDVVDLNNLGHLNDVVGPDIEHLLFEGVDDQAQAQQLPFDFGKITQDIN